MNTETILKSGQPLNTAPAKPETKYKAIFEKNPFNISMEHRLTSINCPSCQTGLLYVKYTNNGGDFVCDCGFTLP